MGKALDILVWLVYVCASACLYHAYENITKQKIKTHPLLWYIQNTLRYN